MVVAINRSSADVGVDILTPTYMRKANVTGCVFPVSEGIKKARRGSDHASLRTVIIRMSFSR